VRREYIFSDPIASDLSDEEIDALLLQLRQQRLTPVLLPKDVN
jgi:hypothetical protein